MSQLLKNIIVGSLVSYLSLAICMPATAQSLDGSANVSDDFHALFYGLSNSKEPLDQPLSARIAFEVVSDRALTKDERDLLLELKRSDIETVAISSPSGKASSIPVATLKGKEIFDYILAKEKFDAAYQLRHCLCWNQTRILQLLQRWQQFLFWLWSRVSHLDYLSGDM